MVYSINECLALDRIRASLKKMSPITDAFVNMQNQLVFNFTDGTQVVIDLKKVVKSY